MDPVLDSGAQAQISAIAKGQLSAETLMEKTLERIAQKNGALNAIVSMRPKEDLLREARTFDQDPRAGALAGLPIAIKDLANVAGLPTSQGSPIFAGNIAEQDDLHVARLRAAGAIIIGKTNTPEFGIGGHTYNPVFGPTCNPYAPALSCGGSSGGAAVALAAGMLSLADGSDMMGSLRTPAGWCNVYGMRPSWGRVPGRSQGELYLHQLSVLGPMARNPRDLAMLLDVLSGFDPGRPQMRDYAPIGDLEATSKGARIAWLGDWDGQLAMEPGILDLCESALAEFQQMGADVVAVAGQFSREALWESWTVLRAWAQAAELNPLYQGPEHRQKMKPEAVWETEKGNALSGADILRASAIRSDWYRAAMELFEIYDAFALPTAQVWPFGINKHWPDEIDGQSMDTYHRWMEVTIPASLIGLPALAIPAGFGPAGLPMGLQLIGRPGSDRELLNLAEAYHQRTDWPNRRRPDL